MSSNNDILAYIKRYFKPEINLQDEINKIFNNLVTDKCYLLIPDTSNFVINASALVTPRLIDLAIPIPNLFRKCYYNKSGVDIPNICPRFIFNSSITYYYPLTISNDDIKSYLYFNFPANIYSYSGTDSITQLLSKKQLLIDKKVNVTYGSYSSANELFSQIYNPDCMLIQLLKFNSYINESYSKTLSNEVLGNFNIIWDFTQYCISYTKYIEDTYIVDNPNVNIDQSIGNNTYILKNGILSKINLGENKISSLPTFYKILEIALQVYEDILLELQYFISSSEYCQKE